MFISTATAHISIETEVPPALKKGRGRPVVGIMPMTTATFSTHCTPIMAVMPPARRLPKRSGQRMATRRPKNRNAANSVSTATHPNQPRSSPTTANMKSDSG